MLKVSLIVSTVMSFVWILIVAVLYLAFGSLDVWNKVNATYETLSTSHQGPLITTNGVSLAAAVLGAITIVVFTTLSTIVALLYNAAAAMTGGLQITMGERP